MRLFFVNTDAVSYGGVSRHDAWLGRNTVVTSGQAKYREALARIPAGARVLLYVNGVGVVAAGEAVSDGVLDIRAPATVNPSEAIEYHRPVAWLLDLRANPIARDELVALLGQGPVQAVQEVLTGKEALLRRLANLEAVPTSDAGTYLRVASELRQYGPVERPTGNLEPPCTSSQTKQYCRDPKIRAWTLQRALGRCELCGQPAPFVDQYQEPYLESHHITTLADRGADTPENTAALCANCHRELHLGAKRLAKTEQLRALIAAKEAGMRTDPHRVSP